MITDSLPDRVYLDLLSVWLSPTLLLLSVVSPDVNVSIMREM